MMIFFFHIFRVQCLVPLILWRCLSAPLLKSRVFLNLDVTIYVLLVSGFIEELVSTTFISFNIVVPVPITIFNLCVIFFKSLQATILIHIEDISNPAYLCASHVPNASFVMFFTCSKK